MTPRRPFLLAAALAAFLSPVSVAALSYDAPPTPPKGRVEVVVDRAVVKLNYILVLNRDGIVGLDLRKAVQQFDERQSAVSTMLRSLDERPMHQQLARARKVGTVYYAMRSLFVMPDAEDIGRSHAMIRAGDRSYVPSPLMAKFKLDERPDNSLLMERGAVGEAWLSEDRLILVVDPVLGGPMF